MKIYYEKIFTIIMQSFVEHPSTKLHNAGASSSCPPLLSRYCYIIMSFHRVLFVFFPNKQSLSIFLSAPYEPVHIDRWWSKSSDCTLKSDCRVVVVVAGKCHDINKRHYSAVSCKKKDKHHFTEIKQQKGLTHNYIIKMWAFLSTLTIMFVYAKFWYSTLYSDSCAIPKVHMLTVCSDAVIRPRILHCCVVDVSLTHCGFHLICSLVRDVWVLQNVYYSTQRMYSDPGHCVTEWLHLIQLAVHGHSFTRSHLHWRRKLINCSHHRCKQIQTSKCQ